MLVSASSVFSQSYIGHYNSATGHSNCMHSSIMLRSSCQTKVSLRIPSMIQLHWFLWQVLLLYASQTRLIINLWGTYLGTWEKQFITIYRNPPSFDSHLLSSPNVIQDTYRCIKSQKTVESLVVMSTLPMAIEESKRMDSRPAIYL